jgi:hypothetical protein
MFQSLITPFENWLCVRLHALALVLGVAVIAIFFTVFFTVFKTRFQQLGGGVMVALQLLAFRSWK